MVAGLRPRDVVRVQIIESAPVQGGQPAVRGGVLDNFTSFQVTNDITAPSEASFELGDDNTWNSLGNVFYPGTQFQVFVNDRPRMRGRVEMNDVPFDTQAGAVVRFTVRTKLADAMFASAPISVKVQNASIKDFVLAVYKPLGYLEANFVFDQRTSRNLLTGATKLDGKPAVDLEPLKIEEAKVQPGETIYAAVDRHLRRHGLMHWDSPDGKIVVGSPNDEQDPIYTFNMYRSGARSQLNNVLSGTHTRDWSGVPSQVEVFGKGGKRGFGMNNLTGLSADADVLFAGFYRPVNIVAEGLSTVGLAVRAAMREMAARSKRKDCFSITVDGFSWWNGSTPAIIYAPDTTAMLNTDVAGGQSGAYFVAATTLTRNAADGDTTQMDLVKRGIWKL